MKRIEKTELTVSKILEASLKEFGAKGYAGGKLNNICKSGINKGLIYHNFKNKDELYLTCLKISCNRLVNMIEENGCNIDILKYMNIRMKFFECFPNEAHIFFEAILRPSKNLTGRIQEILQPIEKINEKIYRSAVSAVTLRDGIDEEDAINYFRQMQKMFNGYFSSSEYKQMSPDMRIKEHEENLPKLINFMIFGIAKGDVKK